MQLMQMLMLRRLMVIVVMMRVVMGVRVRVRRMRSVECGSGGLRRLHGRMGQRRRRWWRVRSVMQVHG